MHKESQRELESLRETSRELEQEMQQRAEDL